VPVATFGIDGAVAPPVPGGVVPTLPPVVASSSSERGLRAPQLVESSAVTASVMADQNDGFGETERTITLASMARRFRAARRSEFREVLIQGAIETVAAPLRMTPVLAARNRTFPGVVLAV
jgi:hypothetical protein